MEVINLCGRKCDQIFDKISKVFGNFEPTLANFYANGIIFIVCKACHTLSNMASKFPQIDI